MFGIVFPGTLSYVAVGFQWPQQLLAKHVWKKKRLLHTSTQIRILRYQWYRQLSQCELPSCGAQPLFLDLQNIKRSMWLVSTLSTLSTRDEFPNSWGKPCIANASCSEQPAWHPISSQNLVKAFETKNQTPYRKQAGDSFLFQNHFLYAECWGTYHPTVLGEELLAGLPENFKEKQNVRSMSPCTCLPDKTRSDMDTHERAWPCLRRAKSQTTRKRF